MVQLLTPIQEECVRQARNTLNNFLQTRSVIDISMSVNSKTPQQPPLEMDMKLDQLLEEMVIMNSRAQLYNSFIRRKLQVKFCYTVIIILRYISFLSSSTIFYFRQAEQVEENWKGHQNMEELQQETLGHYILLESHFIKQSIQKATSLEKRNEKSLTSSLVDDACYLVQKSVNRAINSKSVDTACALINNAA